jgi:nucleoside-diphosphate-sugar epimerase
MNILVTGVAGFIGFFLAKRLLAEENLVYGIDNLNNYQYWNFHPYPQRTYYAELKYDFK